MSGDDDTRQDGGSAPKPPLRADGPDDDARELDERIAAYLRLGLPAATIVCAIVGGFLQGAAAVMLVLAAGALVAVIAIFWSSIRTLVGETALSGADAYALGAPRAEEEQKRAVLRALKDLEFERSVGKISEEDYQVLVGKYRAEGKRLIRMLDEDAQPRRQKVEALVIERLVREGIAQPRAEDEDPAPSPKRGQRGKAKAKNAAPPAPARPVAQEPPAAPVCPSCGTRNDVDAVFCKKCGTRQVGDVEERDEREQSEERPAAKSEEMP
jgi:ribosomal protein L40E